MIDLSKIQHVGFSGTQEGMSGEQRKTLKKYISHFRAGTMLHIGGCIGADQQAALMADSFGLIVIVYPANDVAPHKISEICMTLAWKSMPAKPALQRNKDIVFNSELMLFTPKEDVMIQRSGTWATYRYATPILHESNIKVIGPNGRLLRGEQLAYNYGR